jgi:hypothetical protein
MSERPRLPYIDLLNFIGLNTKSSNEIKNDLSTEVSLNTDLFQQYGTVSKPFGSSRVLASVYKEGGVAKTIPWVGFFKNVSANGQLDRQVLCNAGTFLHKVNNDGTLTALTGAGKNLTESWKETLPHMAQKAGDLLFITNQDQYLIGHGNTLCKYDGNEITRWGLLAPGDEPNTTFTFGSVGATPPTGPNDSWIPTNGTAVTNSVTTRDGSSILVTKTSTVTTQCYIERAIIGTGLIANTADTAAVRLFVFIPLGQLSNLASSNAIVITMSSDVTLNAGITVPNFATNKYVWTFKVGELFEGWNELQLGFSVTSSDVAFDSHLAITGSPSVGSIRSVRCEFNSKDNATLPAGIGWSKLNSFARGNVDITEGSAGSVFTAAATYSYKITFGSKHGHESNAGSQSATITLVGSDASLNLSNIPVSTDPQVTKRTIYRTVNGGSEWIFVDVINDNVTTTYSDVFNDDSLGEGTPPLAGDVSSDNSPPPQAGIIKFWKHTMFLAGDPENPTAIYWSNPDDVEGVPQLNTATLDSVVTAIYETYSALIVATDLGLWQVTGDSPDFRLDKIINNIGCVGKRAAGETRVDGWMVDRDGMRLFDANNPVKISEPIRDKFDEFEKTFLENTHTQDSKNNNCILMCVPGRTITDLTGNNYIFQYPVDETGQGWWWQLDVPVNVLHLEEIEDANGDFHLYFGSDDGMIYELFDRGSKNWATATSSEPVETTMTTKWFRLGQLGESSDYATGRISPRLLEMIVDGDPCTWTVTIDMATGPNQDTPTATIDVDVVSGDENEKLLRYPVKQVQPCEFLRITAFQGDADVASRILAMRLYFHVQPGQFVVESGAFNANIDGIGEG